MPMEYFYSYLVLNEVKAKGADLKQPPFYENVN
jgi:hypothetical protein